jgi:hypothetical protein
MFLAELPRIVYAEQAARPIQPLLVEELAYLLESEARNQQRNLNSALRTQQRGLNKVGMSWTDAMVVPSAVDLVELDAGGKPPAPSWLHHHHV